MKLVQFTYCDETVLINPEYVVLVTTDAERMKDESDPRGYRDVKVCDILLSTNETQRVESSLLDIGIRLTTKPDFPI